MRSSIKVYYSNKEYGCIVADYVCNFSPNVEDYIVNDVENWINNNLEDVITSGEDSEDDEDESEES